MNNVESAIETLKLVREYQRAYAEYGVDRVALIVEDVDTDWLSEWD